MRQRRLWKMLSSQSPFLYLITRVPYQSPAILVYGLSVGVKVAKTTGVGEKVGVGLGPAVGLTNGVVGKGVSVTTGVVTATCVAVKVTTTTAVAVALAGSGVWVYVGGIVGVSDGISVGVGITGVGSASRAGNWQESAINTTSVIKTDLIQGLRVDIDQSYRTEITRSIQFADVNLVS
jgi:hypothetical protein